MLFSLFSFSQVTGSKHHLHCLMTLFSFCENIPPNINNSHRTSVCKDVVRDVFFCGFRITKTQRKIAAVCKDLNTLFVVEMRQIPKNVIELIEVSIV